MLFKTSLNYKIELNNYSFRTFHKRKAVKNIQSELKYKEDEK